jgi:beta-galactosidase
VEYPNGDVKNFGLWSMQLPTSPPIFRLERFLPITVMPRPLPSHLLYGADYNPGQWPPSVWEEDVALMKKAKVNVVSINIFSWATLEPQPDQYTFDHLDRIMNLLAANGIGADLATATASPPTWMTRLFPAMLPVTKDGKKMIHGSRQHYCPNSIDYRRKAKELVRRLAVRYHKHPALQMWHVNNEYGCHVSECYCDQCALTFRTWLRNKYTSISRLNECWSTDFWSQSYISWDDILPPRMTPAQNNPGQVLDYQNFMSDSLLSLYLLEAHTLREYSNAPITTNFMAAFKPIDYFNWAPYIDFISVDIYPPPYFPPFLTALTFDLMRSLKKKPFVVMEQTPSQVNWMAQNPHKRPGDIRLQSLQAVAHGADGVCYFQWRQSRGGAEKFHSAVVSHSGSDNRIFRQAAQIGADLNNLECVVGSVIMARVAIVVDWRNWWAVEYLPGPSDLVRYTEQIAYSYRALHGLNIAVDFVQATDKFSSYAVIVAPLLYLLRPGVEKNLEEFVSNGGSLIVTFFSGIVDEYDRVTLSGYPGKLRELLGVWVEEFDPFIPAMSNEVVIADGPLEGTYDCSVWGEVVHLETANALAHFKYDYYANKPAITVNKFGRGKAYYVATQLSEDSMYKLTEFICEEANVRPVMDVPKGIEVTARIQQDGRTIFFLLNHTDDVIEVSLPRDSRFKELLTGNRVRGELSVGAKDACVLIDKQHSSL